MGKRLHSQRERPESIRKWQLFSCANEARATSWCCCQGDSKLSQLVGWVVVTFDGGDGSECRLRRWQGVCVCSRLASGSGGVREAVKGNVVDWPNTFARTRNLSPAFNQTNLLYFIPKIAVPSLNASPPNTL